MQVIRVAEQDRRADRGQLVRMDGLDGPLRADGHEGRGRHVAVGRVDDAGARLAVRGGEREGAHRPPTLPAGNQP